jgi:uncharacterized protein DUF5681
VGLPPDPRRNAAGRDALGRFRPGVSGNPAKRFKSGVSGNPTGKPKSFSVHQLVAEAIDDNDVRAEAVRRVQENLKNRRTVLSTLELAARLNKEIGLGSEDRPPGVRIVIKTNLRVGALRNGRKVLNGNGHAN